MSAVLVSPKEKKTASQNPSPMDGKEYAVLQKTSSKSLLATLNNTGQSENRVESVATNQNEAETYDETDSYITINNETQDSETNNIISHANQECFFMVIWIPDSGRSSEDYLTIVKSKIRTRPRVRKINCPDPDFLYHGLDQENPGHGRSVTDQAQKSGPTMLQYKLILFMS